MCTVKTYGAVPFEEQSDASCSHAQPSNWTISHLRSLFGSNSLHRLLARRRRRTLCPFFCCASMLRRRKKARFARRVTRKRHVSLEPLGQDKFPWVADSQQERRDVLSSRSTTLHAAVDRDAVSSLPAVLGGIDGSDVLQTSLLHYAWSPEATKQGNFRPERYITMVAGRPVACIILSHNAAPAGETWPYLRELFKPVIPLVLFGATGKSSHAPT